MEQLRRYLDAHVQPLVLIEAGMVAWANRAFGDLVAREPADAIGTALPVAGGFDPEELQSDTCEVALIHASGYLVDVSARLTRVGPGSWMLELRSASYEETQLRDRMARFEALADHLAIGALVSEAGLRLAWVNEPLAEIFEATPAELLGLGWLEHAGDAAGELRGLAMTALTGVPVRTTLALRGHTVDVALRPVQSRDQSLSFVGILQPAHEPDTRAVGASLDVDAVTGLGNLRSLREDLAELLMFEDLWLARVEISGLEAVVDALGSQAGDWLLQRVARRLAGLRVWRSGHASFVIVGEGPGDRLADAVDEALAGEFVVGGAVFTPRLTRTIARAMRGEQVDVALIRLEQAGQP